jgi:hypothetical protein
MKMTPNDLLKIIGVDNPNLLSGIREKQALTLIRATLVCVARTLDTSQEELVVIAGFGRFRIRMVEREVDGKKVFKKRILYVPARAKTGEDDARPKRVGGLDLAAAKS